MQLNRRLTSTQYEVFSFWSDLQKTVQKFVPSCEIKKSQIKMSPCGLMKKANKRTVRVQRQLLDKAKKYGLPEHLKK